MEYLPREENCVYDFLAKFRLNSTLYPQSNHHHLWERAEEAAANKFNRKPKFRLCLPKGILSFCEQSRSRGSVYIHSFSFLNSRSAASRKFNGFISHFYED